MAECQRRQERLYHAQQEVTRCAQSCGLHENYQDSKPLIYLISYLETGRSDTLKEAINLYERELREDARDDAAARHRKEMQQKANAIYEETARSTAAAEAAARKADEAAFGALPQLLPPVRRKIQRPQRFPCRITDCRSSAHCGALSYNKKAVCPVGRQLFVFYMCYARSGNVFATAAQRGHSSGCWASLPTVGSTFQQRRHLAPLAGRTATVSSLPTSTRT